MYFWLLRLSFYKSWLSSLSNRALVTEDLGSDLLCSLFTAPSLSSPSSLLVFPKLRDSVSQIDVLPGQCQREEGGAPLKIADKKKCSRYKMCHLYCKNCKNSALNKGGHMSGKSGIKYKPGVIGVFSSTRSQEGWI